MNEWIEATPAGVLGTWPARLDELGFDLDIADALSVLMASPETADHLRIDDDASSPGADSPDLEGTDGLRHYVPGTRVFFVKTKATDIGWDATIAGSVYATTGSLSLASAITIFKRVVQTFRLLTPEEMDVVIVMRALCGTRDIEFTTITPAELTDVYADTGTGLDALTTSLVDKGAIRRADTGWRLVP